MFELLYRFLIKHKEVSLPGIGTLSLQMQPAQSEFVNRTFIPRTHLFVFEQQREIQSRKLFSWLAYVCGISEREAVIKLNDFVFDLKRQIESGKEVIWQGVGKLKRGLAGEIKFTNEPSQVLQQPVIAGKVIRENAAHTMLVGEEETTTVEMSEFLNQSQRRFTQWWIIPLAIIILIIMFLGWYFSEYGLTVASNY